MRGKNNNRTMGWLLKRNLFLGIAILIVTFLLVPFQGTQTVRDLAESVRMMTENGLGMDSTYWFVQQLNRYYAYFGPIQQETLAAFFGVVGFGSAMILFRHLFSRRQAMMMAELPQDRTKDLLQRTGCFGILVLLPTALCFALYVLSVWTNGLAMYFRPEIFFRGCAAMLMTELYGYTMGVLCVSVCGTVWSTVLAGAVFMASVEVVVCCWTAISRGYLNPLVANGGSRLLTPFSPAVTLYKGIGDPEKFAWLPGTAAIVLFAGLSVWAYRKNRPENVGRTLNIRALEIPVSAWVTLTGVSGCMYVAQAFTGRERNLWICTVIFIACVWILTRMLLDQRVRVTAKHWPVPVCCGAAIFLTLFCLRADMTGFVRWLPKTENLKAVEYAYGSGPSVRLESKESIDAFMELAGIMRDESIERRDEKPYRQDYANAMLVTFETEGGTVRRGWTQPSDKRASRPLWEVIINGDDYKASQIVPDEATMSIEPMINTFGLPYTDFEQTFGFRYEIRRHPEDENTVKEALKKDLANRTMDDLDTPTVLRVDFARYGETGYIEEYRTYTLHTCDVNTLNVLLGEDAQKWIDYAEGGFMDTGDVVAFRCEYGPYDLNTPISWEKAESAEEAKEWYLKTNFCDEPLYARDTDQQTRLMLTSRTQVRYFKRMGWESVDETEIERLPELSERNLASYVLEMIAE